MTMYQGLERRNGENPNNLIIDIEILKTNFDNILKVFERMETSINKIVDQQEKIINQIYNDMNEHKKESKEEVKELTLKIKNTNKETSLKIEEFENRILKEILDIKTDLNQSKNIIDSLNQYKWTIAGIVGFIAWIISNIPLLDILDKFKK